MPEGHSIHRIALQFRTNFVGKRIAASSPQGRFATGAEQLDGRVMLAATAVGKQLFVEFEEERILRVHLGLYGSWDFAGQISSDATVASAGGRMGQTNQRGTSLEDYAEAESLDFATSIGAPRRLRMAEQEQERAQGLEGFPPPPVGAVRVRLLTDTAVADLRGPTACEVLDPQQAKAVLAKLGPDPLVHTGKEAEDAFVAAVRKKPTPIGLLLMDQSVVSGIGNVYRAELLFRARLDPHTPGREVPERKVRELWRDWANLLEIGVRTGQMMTKDELTEEEWAKAMASQQDRHYVYKRQGLPSPRGRGNVVIEEMGGRNLYWAPGWQKRPRLPAKKD
ncbi:MAG: glycosylase [Naasia sp.]|jgi:endonuclease-8|uniref:Fpg/Nei family DNA glycosylase n=1 Tax=Naasia sp. TaxID=2546198 RepID=UPI00261FFFB9|nr:DNA glycosylase [Naasia sp.]MCU1569382.1 glycosylase [Naasia sp.]